VSEHVLTEFGRALRAEGLSVGTGRVVDFCRAAALLEPGDLYWAGRATLVARERDITVYDRVFQAFFGGGRGFEPPRRHVRVQLDGQAQVGLASPLELVRTKSFARCSPEELAQLAELMARTWIAVPYRRTRRLEAARAGAPDFRRTIRQSFRTAGEPLDRAWRDRRRRRRRLVLLLDVSGSMSDYSRALLMFAHASLRANRRW
jgi:uncharacterized protein